MEADVRVWTWDYQPRRPSGIRQLRKILEELESRPEPPEEDSLSLPLPGDVEACDDRAG